MLPQLLSKRRGLWLLWLLLGPGLRLAWGQASQPFTVQVTPAGPLSLAYGQQAVLTAAATYPAFGIGSGFGNGTVKAIAVQPDGRIVVGGSFTTYQGSPHPYLIRLNADGSPDNTFITPAFNEEVRCLAVHTGSTILVGGAFTKVDGAPSGRDYLVRLTTSGSLDPAFKPAGAGPDKAVNVMALQADNKVLIGGNFTTYDGNASPALARLSTTGKFDSFLGETLKNAAITGIAVQTDQKVIIAGNFGLNITLTIRRYSSDGSLDSDFSTAVSKSFPDEGNFGSTPVAATALAEKNGNILLARSSTSNGSLTNNIYLLNATGAITRTISVGTRTLGPDKVNVLAFQADGKVVVGGDFHLGNIGTRSYLARLNGTTLAIESSFTASGGPGSEVNVIALEPNQQVLVGGSFTTYNGATRNRLVRLATDGSLNDTETTIAGATYTWSTGATGASLTVNTAGSYSAAATVGGTSATSNTVAVAVAAAPITPIAVRITPIGSATVCSGTSQALTAQAVYPAFNSGSGLDNSVESIALQPDGKVLIGGSFTSYNGTTRNRVARLNADGSLDTSFAPTGSGLNNSVYSLALQPDGKVLVGGEFTSYNGTTRNRIARLNADGSLDTSFSPTGSGLDNSLRSVVVQPDGKVLVGGFFIKFNGTARNLIARLNADGSLDTSFAPTGSGLNDAYLYSLALQPDGKVLVGGSFTSYNGTARSHLARLNADGSLDTSFAPAGSGLNNDVLTLALQPDGRVLAGGFLTNYNGTTRNYLARLNADGSLDTSFAPTGSGLESLVRSLALQPDGKVLVGGYFTSYNGTPRNYIIRLNPNGSLDTNFTPTGSGLDNVVRFVALQPNGKVLIGGYFTSYNGAPRTNITRLNADGSLETTDTPATGATYAWAPGGATTASISVAPSTTTIYTATATLAGALATASSTITVNPRPVAVPGAATTICIGRSVQLGAAAVAGLAYSWSPTTGLTNAAIANPIASPTATTIYTLTVTNTTTTCTSTGTVAVTVNPSPTAIPGAPLAICSGSPGQLGAAPVASLTYSWSPAAGLSSSTVANPTVTLTNTTSAAITTTYTLTVTNTATSCTGVGTVAVTVSPAVVATPGAAVVFCSGGSAQLGGPAVAGYTYSWSPAAGLSSSTVASPTVTLTNTTSTATTQLYTLTTRNTTTGCVGTGTVAITVSPLPAVNTGPALSLCSGETGQLGAVGTAGLTYRWRPATGISDSTLANPTITLTNLEGAPRTQTYRLVVTNTATKCVSVGTVAVMVNSRPVATPGNDFSLCSGDTGQLGAAPVAGYTYRWSPATGLSSPTVANPTVTLTTTTANYISYTYALTVTNTATGCAGTNTVEVYVNPLPKATAGPAVTICPSGTAQLGAPGQAGYTYSWSPTTGLNDPLAANPLVTLPNATAAPITATYTLTVTDIELRCVNTATVVVTVSPRPVIDAGPAVALCPGGVGQLRAAAGYNQYRWRPATGLSDSTSASPTVTLPNAGTGPLTQTYRLVATTAAGCVGVGTVAVTVNPLPVAVGNSTKTTCSGTPVAIGSAAIPGYTYRWSPTTDLSDPSAANPTATLTNTTASPSSRTYTLTVTNSSGCQASGTVVVTVLPALTLTAASIDHGPVGTLVTLTGTNLDGVVGVKFGNVDTLYISKTSTQLKLRVPLGAADGLLQAGALDGVVSIVVRTADNCTATINFRVIRSLIISPPLAPTPTPAPPIQSGTYATITITKGGVGTLPTDVTVLDSVVVQTGGTLRLGSYHLLDLPTSKSKFRLQPGATLSLGDPAGITPTGTGAGAVQSRGLRTFSTDANYIYTGRADQQTGAGLPPRVRNLTDSTSAGASLRLTAPTAVAQVLAIASPSNFDLNSQQLTLLSDSSGTALVVNSGGGRVTGTATVQRYIAPNPYSTYRGPGYRYYSPPVAGATVASLQTGNFTPVVNPDYNTAASPRTVLPLPTVFRFDPSRLSVARAGVSALDNGLASPAAPGEVLQVGQGYALQLAPTRPRQPTDKVVVAGTLATGDQTLASLPRQAGPAAGAGWNLIGNPYPAPLDWSLVTAADRPGLDAAIYRYESTGPNASNYSSYVNGIGENPVVALGQSFFVRVSKGQASGTLKLQNRHRVTSFGQQASLYRAANTAAEVGVILEHNGGTHNGRPPAIAYGDKLAQDARVAANGRTDGLSDFNPQLDAYYIPGSSGDFGTPGFALSISAPTPDQEYSIKALPDFKSGNTVPLTARAPEAGYYTIRAVILQNLPTPTGVFVYLDDKLLGQSTNLSITPTYDFSFSAAEVAGTIDNRFVLRFGPAVVTAARPWTATADVMLYPNPARTQVTVEVPAVAGATTVQATLLNALGQEVSRQVRALPATGTRLLLDLQGLANGVYALRLQAGPADVVRRLVVE